jgi:hypothetical protein
MPKVNVYLPDELHDAVKEYGVSLSPVCQRALQREVNMRRLVARGGLGAVADRLWQTKLDEDDAQFADGYAKGATWAREVATYRELERFSREAANPDFVFEIDQSHSFVGFEMKKAIGANYDAEPDFFTRYDSANAYARGVVTGAADIWNRVAGALKTRQPDARLTEDS